MRQDTGSARRTNRKRKTVENKYKTDETLLAMTVCIYQLYAAYISLKLLVVGHLWNIQSYTAIVYDPWLFAMYWKREDCYAITGMYQRTLEFDMVINPFRGSVQMTVRLVTFRNFRDRWMFRFSLVVLTRYFRVWSREYLHGHIYSFIFR